MVDGITILPNFASTPGANTAILPQDTTALDAYFKTAELRHQRDLLKYQKDRDEINQRQKEIDLNTAGTWETDLPEINKKVGSAIDYINANPAAVIPTKDNMQDYLVHRKQFNDLDYSVAKSKSDKATYDLWMQKLAAPNSEYATPENKQLLEDWKAMGVNRPAFQGFPPPPPKNNVFTLVGSMQKDLLGNTTQTVAPDANGTLKTTTVQNYDLEKVPQYLEAVYKSSPDWKDEMDTHFKSLPPEQQQKYSTPANAFSDVVLPLMQAQRGKEAHIVDWTSLNQQRSDLSKKKLTVDYQTDIPVNAQTQAGLQTANAIGGYDISKTGNAPQNILIRPPQEVYDIYNNKRLDVKDIGIKNWNIDIIGVYDFYKDPETGRLVPKQNVDKDPSLKNKLQKVRMAEVNQATDGGGTATYLIPYDENVSQPVKNAGIQLNETGTLKQPKELTGKIDPSTLIKGEQYIVNGKTYIWDGSKLKPQ